MSPIDDELRALMHGRADGLDPTPDPLAGIERRAKGIRRHRLATSLAGTALAVAAVAVAVPAVLTQDKSPTPVASNPEVADPLHPWAYRGAALDADVRRNLQTAWERTHPDSTLTPLFGLDNRFAFIATGGFSGLAEPTDTSPSFTQVKALPIGTTVLSFVVDTQYDVTRQDYGTPRLLVVTAPDTPQITYAPHGTDFRSITLPPQVGSWPNHGIGVADLTGNGPTDRVRVTLHDGTVVEQDAPDTTSPSNLLNWDFRGDAAAGPASSAVRKAFAEAVGGEVSNAHYRAFYEGVKDGVRVTVGQAWMAGDTRAHSVGMSQLGSQEPGFFYGAFTADDADALALLVGSIPGRSTDLLVVVTAPTTGQVSYSPDATTAFQDATDPTSSVGGVTFIDRSTTADNDRLEILDGNGDLDHPVYRGPVHPFLCGAKECG